MTSSSKIRRSADERWLAPVFAAHGRSYGICTTPAAANRTRAGVLAANWKKLDFDNEGVAQRFREEFVEPLFRLAGHTIDAPAVLAGFLDFFSAARALECFYRWHLFGNVTLAEISSSPKFIFNATNLQTGAIWSFRKDKMGDPTIGTRNSDVSLARAVAASSAFPPYLAPLIMRFRDKTEWEDYPKDHSPMRYYDLMSMPSVGISGDQLHEFRKRVVLVDGGIADNLGLIALWPIKGDLYISDGGGRTLANVSPWRNWLSQLTRIVFLIHDQPSRLRAFTAISQFANHDERRMRKISRTLSRDGAYWNMHWPLEDHREYHMPIYGIKLTKPEEVEINRCAGRCPVVERSGF